MSQKGSPRFAGEAGFAHILILIILVAGLIGGLILIKNPTVFKPKAATNPQQPTTSLSLIASSSAYLAGDTVRAQLLVRSDIDSANRFDSKLIFDPSWLEVVEINIGSEVLGLFAQASGSQSPIIITPRPTPTPPSCEEMVPASSSAPAAGSVSNVSTVTPAEWNMLNDLFASFTPEECQIYHQYMDNQDQYFDANMPADQRQRTAITWTVQGRVSSPVPGRTCTVDADCFTGGSCWVSGGKCIYDTNTSNPEWQNFILPNWEENTFNNSLGTISLVGGLPSPGLKTTVGEPAYRIATIVFRIKDTAPPGSVAVVNFTNESAIYRDSDNTNIVGQNKNPLGISIAASTAATSTPSNVTTSTSSRATTSQTVSSTPRPSPSPTKKPSIFQIFQRRR